MCLRRRPTGESEGGCGIIVRAGPPCLILTYRRRQEAWNTTRQCAAFVFMNNAHRASRSVWKTATRNVELGFFLARMRPFALISCFSASVSFLFPPLLRATFANLSFLNINFPFEAFPLPKWFPTQGGLRGAVPGCPATRAPQRAYPALQESGARDRRRARSAPSAPASVRSPPCPRRPFSAALAPRPPSRRGSTGPRCPPPLSPAPESRRSAPRGAEAGREGPSGRASRTQLRAARFSGLPSGARGGEGRTPLSRSPLAGIYSSRFLPKFRARAGIPSPGGPELGVRLRLAPIHPAKVKRWAGGRPRLARNVRRSRTQTMISPPSSATGPARAPPSRAPPRPGHRPPGLPRPGPHCCPARAMPGATGAVPASGPEPPPAAGAGSAHTFPS